MPRRRAAGGSARGLHHRALGDPRLAVLEAGAVLEQELHGAVHLAQQVLGHAHGEVALHDDAEHGLLGRLVREEGHALVRQRVLHGHVVAADVPVPLRDDVLQVDVVEAQADVGVDHGRDHGQADLLGALPHGVQDDEDRLAVLLDLLEALADALGHEHLVLDLRLVALEAQAQELVELHVDALGRAREVEGVGIRTAAKVRDVDGHGVGEPLALAPHDPAGAATGVAELVAAG
mmetsp:Transcript_92863/g.300319  ORF Transcript_92863/g.300319 Transcript_92863/m.300319 type:complete len:234 (-) Transcript_92863:950-1651(-)